MSKKKFIDWIKLKIEKSDLKLLNENEEFFEDIYFIFSKKNNLENYYKGDEIINFTKLFSKNSNINIRIFKLFDVLNVLLKSIFSLHNKKFVNLPNTVTGAEILIFINKDIFNDDLSKAFLKLIAFDKMDHLKKIKNDFFKKILPDSNYLLNKCDISSIDIAETCSDEQVFNDFKILCIKFISVMLKFNIDDFNIYFQ